MRVAIIYVSKHGTTEKVAGLIAEKLTGSNEVELFSLTKKSTPDISRYEMVILGSAVYAGNVSGKMKAFCKANESVLLQKKMGLFVCGMHPQKEQREKELQDAYPATLQQKAEATGFLGGEFLFEQMNFFERFIIKRISKVNRTVHRIDKDTIDEFALKLKEKGSTML